MSQSGLLSNNIEISSRGRFACTAVVVAALVFGISLRWLWLGHASLWFDEGYTAWVVSHPPGEIVRLIRADTAPPLYYLLLRAWVDCFGSSETALRAMSAVISSIALIGFYPLAKRLLRDPAAAALAVVLFSISPMQVEHGREARFYPLMALLIEISLWLVLNAVEKRTVWRLLVLILVWTIALYTNNIMAFYLAGLGVAWLILPGKRSLRQRIVDLTIVASMTAILYSPWVPTAMVQARSIQGNFWTRRPTESVFLHTVIMLAGGNEKGLGNWHKLSTIPAFGCIFLAVVAGLSRRDTFRTVAALAAVGLGPLAVIFIYSHFRQSIFVDRSFIPTTVFLPLLLVLPLNWMGKTLGRWLIIPYAAMLIIPTFLSLKPSQLTASYEDWRTVCREVQARSVDRQLVVFVANEGELLYDYYVRNGDYSRQRNLIGMPADFFDLNPPRTMRRVRSEDDLSGLKAELAAGGYDRVIMVDSHYWWSDNKFHTRKFLDMTLEPRGQAEIGEVAVRWWDMKR